MSISGKHCFRKPRPLVLVRQLHLGNMLRLENHRNSWQNLQKILEQGTPKISAPENRIMYAIYAFVLTPRDNDLVNPLFGPVLTAPLHILTRHGWAIKRFFKNLQNPGNPRLNVVQFSAHSAFSAVNIFHC